MWNWWMEYSPLHYGETLNLVLALLCLGFFRWPIWAVKILKILPSYRYSCLLPKHAFVLRRGLFVLQGDWEREKKESARGTMGRGKKIREAVALSLFPSSNARSLFKKIYDLLEYPVRASGGESEHAKNPSLKRCTFCSGKISSQPRKGCLELWGWVRCN